MNNLVSDNNEGIVCINSSPILAGNKIESNKNIGLLAIKKNHLNLTENQFKNNKGPGLFIRDNFEGNFIKNEIENNSIDMVIEDKKENMNSLLD